MSITDRHFYDFGPFRVDPVNRELMLAKARVPLTPRAFDTLLVLVQEAGQVVGKDELLNRVWPGTHVAEATLTQNIYTIRKTLEKHEPEQQYVETIPRRGYRFSALITRRQMPASSLHEPSAGIRVLAVLPFLPLGIDDKDSFLGLGMADALITRLTRISGLGQIMVRPTSAILKYADVPHEPVSAGRELGVDAVLEGTVQRRGADMRVTVQLVLLRDASSLWAETFDVVFTDFFSVQDEISRRVGETLRLRLTGEEGQRLAAPTTSSVEAHQAYVKGRYHWNRRSADGMQKAIEHFEEALQHDPDYVLACAGLADAYALLPLYGTRSPKEVFPLAKQAALRALELNDTVAEGHTSIAYVHLFYDWKWAAAERSFARALELEPGYSTAHHWCAFLHAARGRHEEAVDSAMRALELDPLSLAINSDLGLLLYFARRFEEAIAQFRVALELNPDFAYARFGLALACVQLGRIDDAVRESRLAVELSGGGTAMLAALGNAYAVGGRRDEALEVLRRLESVPGGAHHQASRLALVQTGLGDTEAALANLSRACDERSRFVVFLAEWPAFDALRDEPDFQSLIHRLGL